MSDDELYLRVKLPDIEIMVAETLIPHRQEHDATTGASRCACGEWEGPFTITTGPRSYSAHLAAVVVPVVAQRAHDDALRGVADLIDGARCGFADPGLRMRWGRRRRALLDAVRAASSGEDRP